MNRLKHHINKIGYFIPFTFYFIVYVGILISDYYWLYNLGKQPDSSYKDIFSLLLSVVLFLNISVLCFAFITVLISFLYFKWKQYKGLIQFDLKSNQFLNPEDGQQQFQVNISPLIIPIIGFMRLRILYDKEFVSQKFSPVSKRNKIFATEYEGNLNWNLSEIRLYQIEKVYIYFEDFFQFFSFATSFETRNRFFVSPKQKIFRNTSVMPRKSEDTSIRIDELRKVEGELINYKNFENNDDVRRIVWKIYAKNKELVVRIPEIMDPYASHIYLYSSFFNHFSSNDVINSTFLNYYKTVCWSVYKQLTSKGFEVKYTSDQTLPQNDLSDADEKVKYSIAASAWQNSINLKDFVKTNHASVLIVSSLNELNQVKEFAESFGRDISIIYVPLTPSLNQNFMAEWFKWLFIEGDSQSTNLTKWNLSPIRFKVNENENELHKVMKQTNKSITI